MSAEQEFNRLQEIKARVEMLIRYFRESGNREAELVKELEERLGALRDSSRARMSMSAC